MEQWSNGVLECCWDREPPAKLTFELVAIFLRTGHGPGGNNREHHSNTPALHHSVFLPGRPVVNPV